MYESFEPWHLRYLRDDYKVKKVHAHSPPLSSFSGPGVEPRGGGNWGTLRIPFGKIGEP